MVGPSKFYYNALSNLGNTYVIRNGKNAEVKDINTYYYIVVILLI